MAATKVKRSVRNKQSAVSTQSTASRDLRQSAKPKFANHQSKTTHQKLTHFLETKGRIVEDVQFFTGPSYNCLELRFQDNTTLTIEIQPSFALETYFPDGNRAIRAFFAAGRRSAALSLYKTKGRFARRSIFHHRGHQEHRGNLGFTPRAVRVTAL